MHAQTEPVVTFTVQTRARRRLRRLAGSAVLIGAMSAPSPIQLVAHVFTPHHHSQSRTTRKAVSP